MKIFVKNKLDLGDILILILLIGIISGGVFWFLSTNRTLGNDDLEEPPNVCFSSIDNTCTQQRCETSGGNWSQLNEMPPFNPQTQKYEGGGCVCSRNIGESLERNIWMKGFGCDYVQLAN